MALTNMYSGSSLYALDHQGIGVSEEIVQELVDTDFNGLKTPRVYGEYKNIGSYACKADKLIVANPVEIGDIIYIYQGGAFHELLVATVTPTIDCVITPKMDSNTYPRGTFSYGGAYVPSGAFYLSLFPTVPDSASLTSASHWVEYRFENDELVTVNKMIIKENNDGYIIKGSTNGIDWDVVHTSAANTGAGIKTVTFSSPGAYSRYRIYKNVQNLIVYSWYLLGDGYEVDTSPVTAGQIPYYAYKDSFKIDTNGVPWVKKDVFLEFESGTAKNAEVFIQYEDVSLPVARELITTVEINSMASRIVEITSDIYKEDQPEPPFSISKATADANSITVHFPSPISVVGDILLSCSAKIDGGSNIVPDVSTPAESSIVFNFPASTFMNGQVITFEYDDSVGGDILETSTSDELASGSYSVINSIL